MTFYKIESTEPLAQYLAKVISEHLIKGQKVLWLVPGGSSIAVASKVARLLKNIPLERLSVTLTDERYGEVGHADSNWQQLEQVGFSLSGARLLSVLRGKTMEEATLDFANTLEKELDSADFRIGLFGIGADGHTAGILPNSPAVSSKEFASSYDAGEFKRITLTPLAIARLDEAVVYATGESKQAVLDSLEKEVQLNEQPAQALKQVDKLTIYNDYKGEKV